MPIECLQCGFVTADEATKSCPRCQSAHIRFSLLAGLKVETSADKVDVVKLEADKPPGLGERIGQAAVGIVMALFVMGLGTFGVHVWAMSQKIDSRNLYEANKLAYLAAAYSIPLVAVILATAIPLYKVYLAQFVGAWIGGISTAIFLVARLALGAPPTLGEWIVLIPGSVVMGFTFGFAVAGKLKISERKKEVEYKPLDSWDRDAKAREMDLPIDPSKPWKMVFVGYLVGAVTPTILTHLMYQITAPAYQEPRTAWFRVIEYTIYLQMIGYFFGGLAATIGLRRGWFQGTMVWLLVAANYYLYIYISSKPFILETFLMETLPALPACIIGGMVGGFLFPPPSMIRGKKVEGSPLDLKYETDDTKADPKPIGRR